MAKKKRTGVKSKKKPEWTGVTFGDLDAWRAKHSIPKKRLAHFLGVTNSTWHNWQGGRANATLVAQQRIKDLIAGEPPAVLMDKSAALKRPAREPRVGGGRRGRRGFNGSEPEPIVAAAPVDAVAEAARLNAIASIVTAAVSGNTTNFGQSQESVVALISAVRRALA